MSSTNQPASPTDPVAKITGADVELASIDPRRNDRGARACRELLARVDGIPAGYRANWMQDSARIFLPQTGGSTYIDMDHWEWATPETRSAWDFTAAFHATLELARDATRLANTTRGEADRIRVYANNSDGHSNSWGGHNSFLLSRRAYSWLFRERLHYLLFLASAQVSSIIITGAGKVGSENGADHVGYQISQRADFFECLVAERTTFSRPIVNCRNESLADGDQFARLHCIFYDTALCHTSNILRIGFMQLTLAMIEAEQIDPSLIFEDPLNALNAFSHDPALNVTAGLISRRRVSAVDHQAMLLEHAARFVESGAAEKTVPRAGEILELWAQTLELFARKDWSALSSKIDWVAKRALLENAIARRGLDWDSPELKLLDHQWSELEAGIYRTLENADGVEHHVSKKDIRRAKNHPPNDTRAYARSLLLQRFPRGIRSVDWHEITLWHKGERLAVTLPDPARGTRESLQGAESLESDGLLKALGAEPAPYVYRSYSAPVISPNYKKP